MDKNIFNKVYELLAQFKCPISVVERTLSVVVQLDNHLDITLLHETSRLCSVEVKGRAAGTVLITAIIPKNRVLEEDTFDEQLVYYLSKGFKQNDIAIEFKRRGIVPCHIRTIEKRINDLKHKYNANTLFELAVVIEKLKINNKIKKNGNTSS